MTFKNFRVAASISIPVALLVAPLCALSACSSSTSSPNNAGGDSGTGTKQPVNGQDGGGTGEDAAAGPAVGVACTAAADCTSPATCSTLFFKNGPIFPSPICIEECTPGASSDTLTPCGSETLPGAGICQEQQDGTGICFPLCYVTPSGTVDNCLANNVCQVAGYGPDPSNTAQVDLIGTCQAGCTADSQCPTGSKCDTYEGVCLTTVVAPTKSIGTTCDPATETGCICIGTTGSSTGFCSSTCVTGGPACPQPGATGGTDGGIADAGATSALPYVCSAQLGGINALDAGIAFSTQPSGLDGFCFQACDLNTDCASLGTGATCAKDPAGGTHLGVCSLQ